MLINCQISIFLFRYLTRCPDRYEVAKQPFRLFSFFDRHNCRINNGIDNGYLKQPTYTRKGQKIKTLTGVTGTIWGAPSTRPGTWARKTSTGAGKIFVIIIQSINVSQKHDRGNIFLLVCFCVWFRNFVVTFVTSPELQFPNCDIGHAILKSSTLYLSATSNISIKDTL